MTTIRLARIEELESLYGLIQEATRHMDNQDIPQWDDIYPSKAILNAYIENQQMYLIEVEGRVAGLIVINEDQSPEYASVVWKHGGRALVVHRLTIHPDYQRHKLASNLMDLAEEIAVTENYDCIRLDAFTPTASPASRSPRTENWWESSPTATCASRIASTSPSPKS